jgi:hypothetical protein
MGYMSLNVVETKWLKVTYRIGQGTAKIIEDFLPSNLQK